MFSLDLTRFSEDGGIDAGKNIGVLGLTGRKGNSFVAG